MATNRGPKLYGELPVTEASHQSGPVQNKTLHWVKLASLAAGMSVACHAHAHDGKGSSLPGEALRQMVSQLPNRSDVVPWTRLAAVRTKVEGDATVAIFDHKLLALNGKRQRLQGYMLPLDGGAAQRHFLLSATPNSCPGTPETMVYVKLRAPVEFRMGVVAVEGLFNVAFNEETGMYYRMTEARFVK